MSLHSSLEKTVPKQDSQNHVNWDELYNSGDYRMLVKAKRRFIIPALVFFTAYYTLLLVIQGYFPDIASKPVIGSLNFGYLYSLSQLPVAWILCFAFIRYSQRSIDSLSQDLAGKSRN